MPYNYHTASRKILGDLVTPVSAYLKLRDAYPQSALMESSDYHGGENAKSFIAVHPIGSVSIEHGIGICKYPADCMWEPAKKPNPPEYVDNDWSIAISIEKYATFGKPII